MKNCSLKPINQSAASPICFAEAYKAQGNGYLIKDFIFSSVDPVTKGFDPGFFLFRTRSLEFDIIYLETQMI